MASLKMAMKIILYILIIPLVSGKPFVPPGVLSRGNRNAQGVKIPLYMMNLYQTLRRNKDLKRPENHILKESDTVQSLTAKDFTLEDNRLSLTFDLSPITRTDELRMVELRIHLPPFLKYSNITVKIYHVNNGQHKVFLGSVMTNIPDSGNTHWTTFNVTRMMENSLLWGKELTNQEEGDMTLVDMPARNVFQYARRKRDASLLEISTDQALILFFTKNKPFSKTGTPILLKKLAMNIMKRVASRRYKRSKSEIRPGSPSSVYRTTVEEHKLSCRKVDMVVNFKEIGWDNWVMYPKKYHAYRCEGTCHSPLSENSMTTNYDYIKSFIKLKDFERMECPSCVPLKMQPLTMMFHENRHLVLRHHDNMIIEECGFQ